MGRDSKKIYKCLKIEQSGKVTYTKQLSLPIPADKENRIYLFLLHFNMESTSCFPSSEKINRLFL